MSNEWNIKITSEQIIDGTGRTKTVAEFQFPPNPYNGPRPIKKFQFESYEGVGAAVTAGITYYRVLRESLSRAEKLSRQEAGVAITAEARADLQLLNSLFPSPF